MNVPLLSIGQPTSVRMPGEQVARHPQFPCSRVATRHTEIFVTLPRHVPRCDTANDRCDTRRVFSFLTPELPVEHTVVDRFANMLDADLVGAVDIGNRSRYAQHLVVGPSRQSQLIDALLQ
jgi:hypothetical protein